MRAEIGVIGGSGVYEIAGLEQVEAHQVETPFGRPSSPLWLGEYAGRQVAFLARHGESHTLSPTEINPFASVHDDS